jgi:DNA gyrase/topoisomerase IV subunit A
MGLFVLKEANLISIEKIEEWIHEVKERPGSAPLILEYISKRLKSLSDRNEELLAENIELRTGKKVDEFEKRIATLEYQLEMLKRQVGETAEVNSLSTGTAPLAAASILVYNHLGKLLRADIPSGELKSGGVVGLFKGDPGKGVIPPRLLVTANTEELLCVFDSGRTEAFPVSAVPKCEPQEFDWQHARLVEPRGSEELTVVLPIARMSLHDFCVQSSRRGCVKKMMKTSFEGHVARGFVGAGVKSKPDRTCTLTFAGKSDRLVLATYEGYLANLAVEDLPFNIEEGMRLAVTDYLLAAFTLDLTKPLVVITNGGKVVQRDASWLEPAETFRTKGQAIFSQARRDAGVRCAGAVSADENDWAVLLLSDGKIMTQKMGDLFASGSVFGMGSDVMVVDFFSANLRPAEEGR